jgi:translation initiation factor IF-3
MVRLVLADGQHLGIVTREQALQRAQEEHLDLVEVAPEANPAVCKLMDYGKFMYRQKKRERQKHHKSQMKEIRIGPDTQEHDLNFKAGRVREFLAEHHKVLVSMTLSGRHKAHGDLALEHMRAFAQRFEDVAKLERAATRERANRLSMLLAPR